MNIAKFLRTFFYRIPLVATSVNGIVGSLVSNYGAVIFAATGLPLHKMLTSFIHLCKFHLYFKIYTSHFKLTLNRIFHRFRQPSETSKFFSKLSSFANFKAFNFHTLAQNGTLGHFLTILIPASNCMFKVNNRNNRTRCEICSKLTIKRLGRRQWRLVSIINFEHISHYCEL